MNTEKQEPWDVAVEQLHTCPDLSLIPKDQLAEIVRRACLAHAAALLLDRDTIRQQLQSAHAALRAARPLVASLHPGGEPCADCKPVLELMHAVLEGKEGKA